MVTTHNLGFPRIGAKRELKFALEDYWKGLTTQAELADCGAELRKRHWEIQADLDYVPIGDFSFYDQVLDTSFLLGNIPERVKSHGGNELDHYFRAARGRSASDSACACVHAGEMTKWFDTNYHYIVPEFTAATEFTLNPSRLLDQIAQARRTGVHAKPVIIGPMTYLWLGKSKDGSDRLDLLPRLLPQYAKLFEALSLLGIDWVQIDEPILVTELDTAWQRAFTKAYEALNTGKVKVLLATYFGQLKENLPIACGLPVQGLHLDAVNAKDEIEAALQLLPEDAILSLGVINGRNIWKTDLHATLGWLEPIHRRLADRLWIAPSCSLLHVPVDLTSERKLDRQIKSWLAFAIQKLIELRLLAKALNNGRVAVQEELVANAAAIQSRAKSKRVHNPEVTAAIATIDAALGCRAATFEDRATKQ